MWSPRLGLVAFLCAFAYVLLDAERLSDVVAEHGSKAVRGGEGTYQYIRVANAPISSVCPLLLAFDKKAGTAYQWGTKYMNYRHACGLIDPLAADGMADEKILQAEINDHVDRWWSVLKQAHKQLVDDTTDGETMYIFVAPEWALGRRYPHHEDSFDPRPLEGKDFEEILTKLSERMTSNQDGLSFKHWLVVPGTMYWGLPMKETDSDEDSQIGDERPSYAVFNSAPIFWQGRLEWVVNKEDGDESVNYLEGGDTWANADGFDSALLTNESLSFYNQYVAPAKNIHASAIFIAGWAVGVDICRDHWGIGGIKRASERAKAIRDNSLVHETAVLDILLLVSSGAALFEEMAVGRVSTDIRVRQQGVAISSDGAWPMIGGSQPELWVRKTAGNFTARDFSQVNPTEELNSWQEKCIDKTTEPELAQLQHADLCKEECKDFQPSDCKNPGADVIGCTCLAQPGNFARLKVWKHDTDGNPIQLQRAKTDKTGVLDEKHHLQRPFQQRAQEV